MSGVLYLEQAKFAWVTEASEGGASAWQGLQVSRLWDKLLWEWLFLRCGSFQNLHARLPWGTFSHSHQQGGEGVWSGAKSLNGFPGAVLVLLNMYYDCRVLKVPTFPGNLPPTMRGQSRSTVYIWGSSQLQALPRAPWHLPGCIAGLAVRVLCHTVSLPLPMWTRPPNPPSFLGSPPRTTKGEAGGVVEGNRERKVFAY